MATPIIDFVKVHWRVAMGERRDMMLKNNCRIAAALVCSMQYGTGSSVRNLMAYLSGVVQEGDETAHVRSAVTAEMLFAFGFPECAFEPIFGNLSAGELCITVTKDIEVRIACAGAMPMQVRVADDTRSRMRSRGGPMWSC